MGYADQASPRLQQSGGCARQQERAHHLGAADSGRELSAAGDLGGFTNGRSNQFNSGSSVVRRNVLSWLLSRFIGDGNRSDRRFANLANPLALEAVVPIRTRRADSIMARSKSQSSSQRPYIRMQPASPIDRAACD